MSAPKALAHLDPNNLTRLAYVVHTAGDPARTNPVITPLARRELEQFDKLQTTFDLLSPEGQFLFSASAIVIGMAQEISRRKRECQDDIAAIDHEFHTDEHNSEAAQVWSIAVKAVYTALKWLVWLALGWLIGQLLALVVPDAIAHHTGREAPSAILAIGSWVICGFASFKFARFNEALAKRHYHDRLKAAKLRYAKGRLDSYRESWVELTSVYERYTGTDYVSVPFFEMVLKEDYQAEVNDIAAWRARQTSSVQLIYHRSRRAAVLCLNALKRYRDHRHVSQRLL